MIQITLWISIITAFWVVMPSLFASNSRRGGLMKQSFPTIQVVFLHAAWLDGHFGQIGCCKCREVWSVSWGTCVGISLRVLCAMPAPALMGRIYLSPINLWNFKGGYYIFYDSNTFLRCYGGQGCVAGYLEVRKPSVLNLPWHSNAVGPK
jgi:hypothetical protein